MFLPQYVQKCMEILESAGCAAYAVGGCVRDAVLGLTPQDYDLCTAALPEQMKSLFSGCRLILAGEKHGTVSVITDGGVVEITTFRSEGDYRDSRHPGWVRFVPDIESDLARRDFTVNAMAYSPLRGFSDPFGGREDLKNRILRTVGDPAARFEEDTLRILRGMRFSLRYRLTPEEKTLQAMEALAPRMEHLARERVFSELCKLLPLAEAEDLLRYRQVLGAVIPALRPTFDFDQHSPHHAYDLYTHIAHVTAAVPGKQTLRWAALLHDIGKVPAFTRDETGRGHFYGHAQLSAQMADEILLSLKAPTRLREQVVLLIHLHMTRIEPDKKQIRRFLGKHGEELLWDLIDLQEADMSSKGTGKQDEMDQFTILRTLTAEVLQEDACFSLKDLAVDGNDLVALGFVPGKAIGQCLTSLLNQVVEETLPNEKEALLAAAREML